MSIHPDLTAYRAVDACGGTYTPEQEASGYAQGHRDALEAACNAVQRVDRRMAQMAAALDECDEYFDSRADADCDQDGFHGNAEMGLLVTVREALAGGAHQASITDGVRVPGLTQTPSPSLTQGER